jgi:putative toxin-antitoxin system antitoxin component (TIGR02293 family)
MSLTGEKKMTVSQVAKRLGIKDQVRTPLDYIALSDKGLPRETVLRLMDILSISLIELAQLLPVSKKTVERYRHDLKTNLNRSVSERVLRIALVSLRCEEVFGKNKVCNEWLKTKNIALGDKTPLSLMRSDFGIDMVLNELGRIEHGIIS